MVLLGFHVYKLHALLPSFRLLLLGTRPSRSAKRFSHLVKHGACSVLKPANFKWRHKSLRKFRSNKCLLLFSSRVWISREWYWPFCKFIFKSYICLGGGGSTFACIHRQRTKTKPLWYTISALSANIVILKRCTSKCYNHANGRVPELP